MNLRRPAMALWILFLFAVACVFVEIRGVQLKYALAERQKRLHAAVLAHRTLKIEVETARRPEVLARRAKKLSVVSSQFSVPRLKTDN
jgi:hypothetical protein